MTRSLFDPTDLEASLRRIASSKGKTFRYFLRYLEAPSEIQHLLPVETQTYYLRNIRSDLSTWRSAVAQVPPTRLLTIPWIALLTLSRSDLIGQSENFCIARIMEDIRLFTTQLRPDGLRIGSVITFGSYEVPSFTNEPPKTTSSPEPEKMKDSQRIMLEGDLEALYRRREKTELRANARYSPDRKAAAELIEIDQEIQTIKERLES